MSRPDDEQVVDLDVTGAGTDPGVDEELPEPAGGGQLHGRRVQVVLALAVAAVLVALALVRVLSTGGDTPTASAPSASASPETSTPGVTTSVGLLHGQTVEQCVDLKCGQGVTVQVRTPTPADLQAALRRQFPGARIVSAVNIANRTAATLLFRRIVARSGAQTVVLTIAAYREGDSDRAGYADDGGGSSVYYEYRRRSLQISVRVSAPVGARLHLAPVMRLGDDQRILAV